MPRVRVSLTQQSSGREQRFTIRPRLNTDSLYALRNAALAGMGAWCSWRPSGIRAPG